MRLIARHLRRRAHAEHGFTLITVMAAMTGIMLLSIAAISVAQGDLGNSAADTQTKQAYQAAEAGINEYAYHLTQDNNYWTKCDGVPSPAPVNQPFAAASSTTTIKDAKAVKWRTVPGTTSSYAIELLPVGWTPATANNTKICDVNNASGSMIDTSTGTFRIRSTGRTPYRGGYRYRTIVTTFRKKGFLDFLYFTDLETKDPTLYTLDTGGQAGDPNVVAWASNNCGKTYWRDGRGNMSTVSRWDNTDHTVRCTEIQFVDGDSINGPFHTNDSFLVCGTPDFGRTSADKIETQAADGWRANSGCGSSSPNFKGTYRPSSGHLDLPKTNTSIKANTASAYQYTGTTTLTLKGTTMDVVNPTMGINQTNVALPANGVINVADGNCGVTYDPLNTGGAPAGCGNVYVKGTYSKDLTIAAESDIIVSDSLTKTNDSVLGLIANQFVRVAHPVKNLNKSSLSCDNDNPPTNVKIDAGILALNHSFIVDNYFCGAPLGTLTVNGVIAQKYRGPVGTGNGSTASTGYLKKYDYDDRLTLRQPPFFLNPVESSWRVARQIEQTGR